MLAKMKINLHKLWPIILGEAKKSYKNIYTKNKELMNKKRGIQ